jgi:hypothetical protein
MWKILAGFSLGLLSAVALSAELSATEKRWLAGAWPVVVFAKQSQLPLDIVVQPQPMPQAAPLALAYVDGRCKLVLSMRGNPEAEATLERLAPELRDPALELMAAHELGHCRRYVDGAWHSLPARFADPGGAAPAGSAQGDYAQMQRARREEGYSDLVGLAWTQRRHPELYARLHAWLLQDRAHDHVPGSPHDTLAWLRLARDGAALDQASIFDAAAALWVSGLAELD